MLCLRHKVEAKLAHPLLSSRPQGRQTFHPLFSDALCMVLPARQNLKVGLPVDTLLSMQHNLQIDTVSCCLP